MDCRKVGKLIMDLRKEKQMTQKQLANVMNISDKTISKWERGLGCPDVTLLCELSNKLGINIENILRGDLTANEKDRGNMMQTTFYVCSHCGNILNSTTKADIFCCGRQLEPLIAKQEDAAHEIQVSEVENDYFISIQHEMSKTHYISFISYIASDKIFFVKMYPEQNAELRIPKMNNGKLYAYCNQHGLWMKKIE